MGEMYHREDNRAKWIGVRPGHDGEQVVESGEAENTTVTIYTVPADYVFFLCNFIFAPNASGGGVGRAYIEDNTAALWMYLAHLRYSNAYTYIIGNSHFNPPVEIPEGYQIKLFSSAAAITTRGSIFGWKVPTDYLGW